MSLSHGVIQYLSCSSVAVMSLMSLRVEDISHIHKAERQYPPVH